MSDIKPCPRTPSRKRARGHCYLQSRASVAAATQFSGAREDPHVLRQRSSARVPRFVLERRAHCLQLAEPVPDIILPDYRLRGVEGICASWGFGDEQGSHASKARRKMRKRERKGTLRRRVERSSLVCRWPVSAGKESASGALCHPVVKRV